MSLSESDTRAKLIDPAMHQRGWTEDLIRREETAGMVTIDNGKARKLGRGRVDYLLRLKPHSTDQPVAVALIEAKAEHLPPGHGLEQGKGYREVSARFNVPFVFSSNGHQFVEYDRFSGFTTSPHRMTDFPTPDDLRARYEQGMRFSLADEAARALLTPYSGGEATRRYYQDAAIRAVLERIVQRIRSGEPKRALLSLATGAGKTFIAVNLLKRIADAGMLNRALFICDRDELRTQAAAAFQNVFGADAATVSGQKAQKNARILIATYQTLGIDSDEADATFLTANYPENYFSHIIIDECHRSAWGKWSEVLTRNPNAVQVGLTATPRQLIVSESTVVTATDDAVTADNVRYFGEPVYEYDMAQGIEDGYLAACEVVRCELFLDDKPEIEAITGIQRNDLAGTRLTDAHTGNHVEVKDAKEHYNAGSFERRLQLPDRVREMCEHLFNQLLATGGPEQKTIIFCASDDHAEKVATALNNSYSAWCTENGVHRAEPYAFKCTAASGGNDFLPDLRGSSSRYFVATTVDLLSTGVDVPAIRNIVFFRYVLSAIAFYQMIGRGTRIDVATDKLMFRVYDYTNATRLFGHGFATRSASTPSESVGQPPARPPVIEAHGIEVRITEAGRLIVTMVNGVASAVTVEEYKEKLGAKLVEAAHSLDDFRTKWITPMQRRELLATLPDAGRAALLVRSLDEMDDYDLYDVLANLGYGMNPYTRMQRVGAFSYKNENWLKGLPPQTTRALNAIVEQFGSGGTDELENLNIFQLPKIRRAGGVGALKMLGDAQQVLQQTKERLFAA